MIRYSTFILNPQTLLIRLKPSKQENTLDTIPRIVDGLKQELDPYIYDLVPSYDEIGIYFKPPLFGEAYLDQIERVIDHINQQKEKQTAPRNHIIIPVCYEPPFSLDLKTLCKGLGLSEKELIKRHCASKYRVAFIGFLPGFPYLNGMDPSISFPRKKVARKRIKAGSVGIANHQTGIYPSDSPGGWQIIGQTPLQLFDVKQTPPSLIRTGDTVQFKAIGLDEYQPIRLQIEEGTFESIKEVYNG